MRVQPTTWMLYNPEHAQKIEKWKTASMETLCLHEPGHMQQFQSGRPLTLNDHASHKSVFETIAIEVAIPTDKCVRVCKSCASAVIRRLCTTYSM